MDARQTFFRETSCFPKLAALFHVRSAGADPAAPVEWSEQRQRNLISMTELVRLFVSHRSKAGGSGTAGAGSASSAGTSKTGSATSSNQVRGHPRYERATKSRWRRTDTLRGHHDATPQLALVQCHVLKAVAEVALAQDVPSKIKQEVRLVAATRSLWPTCLIGLLVYAWWAEPRHRPC